MQISRFEVIGQTIGSMAFGSRVVDGKWDWITGVLFLCMLVPIILWRYPLQEPPE